MQEVLNVRIKKLNENAVIPFYATGGACGMDITAIDVVYNAEKDYYEYHTGLAFEIPPGYMMQLAPRSSNRKTDAYLTNSIGWIDSDYRGELLVCYKNRLGLDEAYRLWKTEQSFEESAPYKVGDRIAQIMIVPYPYIHFQEVKELSTTERGTGGHGSTGN